MKLQLKHVALALVAVAVLAPTALAVNQPTIALQHLASPDPRDGVAVSPNALAYLPSPDPRDSTMWTPNALAYLPSPDPRDSVTSSPTALSYLAAPDPRGVGPAPMIVPSSGFDWGDAGIGAAIAFGLGVLMVGGALVVLRRRVQGGSGRPAPTPAS